VTRTIVCRYFMRWLNSSWKQDHNVQPFDATGQALRDIRTITFDLDDTLWAIGPVIARAERCLVGWYRENYPRIPERLSADDALAIRDAVISEYSEQAHDLTFLRREVIARMGSMAGYPDIDVDAAFAVFDAARNELDLFPDVRPVLTILRARFTLIAVTNGNASLEKIGIADLFDGFITARAVGAAKPARRIFAAAVEAGGDKPERTLHVGDHPELDVEGARRHGLKTVWVNRGGHAWPPELIEPDGVVDDLHGLERLLPE